MNEWKLLQSLNCKECKVCEQLNFVVCTFTIHLSQTHDVIIVVACREEFMTKTIINIHCKQPTQSLCFSFSLSPSFLWKRVKFHHSLFLPLFRPSSISHGKKKTMVQSDQYIYRRVSFELCAWNIFIVTHRTWNIQIRCARKMWLWGLVSSLSNIHCLSHLSRYIMWFLKRFHLAFLVPSWFPWKKRILLWKAKTKCYLCASFHEIWLLSKSSKSSKLDI